MWWCDWGYREARDYNLFHNPWFVYLYIPNWWCRYFTLGGKLWPAWVGGFGPSQRMWSSSQAWVVQTIVLMRWLETLGNTLMPVLCPFPPLLGIYLVPQQAVSVALSPQAVACWLIVLLSADVVSQSLWSICIGLLANGQVGRGIIVMGIKQYELWIMLWLKTGWRE